MSRPARLRLRILATTLLLASAARAGAETGEELRFFRSLEADGLHAVAAGQMETWLAAHPDDPARTEVEHLLGRSYEAQGDTRRMLRWLARFAADAPEDPRAPEALFAAGRAAVADSLPADAESVLERLLRDHADSARREDALLLLARLRADEGRGAEARQLLGLVIQQTGDAGLLGQALWARAALRDDVDPDGARADRERLMASLPRDSLAVEAALRVAADRRATGDDAAARKALDWALDRSQDAAQQARALRSRAALSADAGRPADAARDLATLRRRLPAAQLSPDDLTREIELLLAADKPQDAVARARERVADAPSAAHLALLARAPRRRRDARTTPSRPGPTARPPTPRVNWVCSPAVAGWACCWRAPGRCPRWSAASRSCCPGWAIPSSARRSCTRSARARRRLAIPTRRAAPGRAWRRTPRPARRCWRRCWNSAVSRRSAATGTRPAPTTGACCASSAAAPRRPPPPRAWTSSRASRPPTVPRPSRHCSPCSTRSARGRGARARLPRRPGAARHAQGLPGRHGAVRRPGGERRRRGGTRLGLALRRPRRGTGGGAPRAAGDAAGRRGRLAGARARERLRRAEVAGCRA
ncbi:MAG: hypothetical protein H6694_03020 [Candidatus Latescibacteria bacterium]|nr:hypothetical protein [Candidatus Latescibacterota bacterium]